MGFGGIIYHRHRREYWRSCDR